MKSLMSFSVVLFSAISVCASVPQNAKICVFEAAQAPTWSTTCDGKVVDYGSYDRTNADSSKRVSDEMAISLHLSELIDAGFFIKSCTGFPNSYGVRCILTK